MKKFNSVFVLLLLMVMPIKPNNDKIDPKSAALGVLGGIMITAIAEAIYYDYTDRSAIKEFKKRIESWKSHYNDECKLITHTNIDQQIQTISDLLLRKLSFSTATMQDVQVDIVRLKNEVEKIKSIKDEKARNSILRELIFFITDVEAYYNMLKKASPFIDLDIAEHNKNSRLREYETILTSHEQFPQVTAVKTMTNDEQRLLHWIGLAEAYCKQSKCTELQKNLINAGIQHVRTIEQNRNNIAQSQEFRQERERFESIKATEKKAEAQIAEQQTKQAQIRLSEQKNRIIETEQSIKQEQLRQNDEQLRQNEKILEAGRYFEPVRRDLENKLGYIASEKKNLETQIKEKDSNLEQLTKNTRENNQAFENIKNESKQLEKDLNTPPFNPESEEGLPEWIYQLKQRAQRIAKNCPTNQK